MKKSEFNQITTEVLVSTERFSRHYMKANVDATRAARLAAKNQVAVVRVVFVLVDGTYVAYPGANNQSTGSAAGISEVVMPLNQLQQYASTLAIAGERYTRQHELAKTAREKAIAAEHARKIQHDKDEALIAELMPALREELNGIGLVSRLHNGKLSIEVQGCKVEAMLEKLVK